TDMYVESRIFYHNSIAGKLPRSGQVSPINKTTLYFDIANHGVGRVWVPEIKMALLMPQTFDLRSDNGIRSSS
ncbi:hypothetical protein NGG37_28475, partial [Klebsiella pneumoniae]|nr:hypothetical protein [Klebsiella pneumoniae]